MPIKIVEITSETDLHARPARLVVATAKQFAAEIKLTLAEKEVSAKSILGVMNLAVFCGERIEIISDDETAVNQLTQLVKNEFNE
ncbi:HPr family phosphocarrier protein [Natroniella acetigena]|uniref:HPr family phosphocarrier protein n=1 Tax=Natroniella acetigena TaxID=52004 RepID=UPI00200A4614|nr:HPr family phosphocarrier protein [Natroniella acetigena]MCK8828291.1 HPr family phosphocarrier protein [Natroniella acetigena]